VAEAFQELAAGRYPANTRKARVVDVRRIAPVALRVKSNAKRPAEAGRFMKRNQKLAKAT
jgi:predicted RNase H-like nuclease